MPRGLLVVHAAVAARSYLLGLLRDNGAGHVFFCVWVVVYRRRELCPSLDRASRTQNNKLGETSIYGIIAVWNLPCVVGPSQFLSLLGVGCGRFYSAGMSRLLNVSDPPICGVKLVLKYCLNGRRRLPNE